MSYCRWSSNDYQCDVYVYEGRDGWVTHVAGGRRIIGEELPPAVDIENTDAWVERYRRVSEIIERAEIVPIGLPHDGETFVDGSPGECADRLEALCDLGYVVPTDAIEALRAEHAELYGGAP